MGSQRGPDPVRVVLADGDPLSRRAVRDVLESERDIEVAAEATNGVEAIELVRRHAPHVLLTEFRLPGPNGIEVVSRLAANDVAAKVIIFTFDLSDQVAVRALRAGAAGVLGKDLPLEAVVRAVRGVTRGQAAITRELAMHVVEQLRRSPEDLAGMRPVKSPLTAREWEVLDLVSSGVTTQEAARVLALNEDTVYSHLRNIMRKLGVQSRREAIEVAERMRQTKLPAG